MRVHFVQYNITKRSGVTIKYRTHSKKQFLSATRWRDRSEAWHFQGVAPPVVHLEPVSTLQFTYGGCDHRHRNVISSPSLGNTFLVHGTKLTHQLHRDVFVMGSACLALLTSSSLFHWRYSRNVPLFLNNQMLYVFWISWCEFFHQ